jgi:hypothetical protein
VVVSNSVGVSSGREREEGLLTQKLQTCACGGIGWGCQGYDEGDEGEEGGKFCGGLIGDVEEGL